MEEYESDVFDDSSVALPLQCVIVESQNSRPLTEIEVKRHRKQFGSNIAVDSKQTNWAKIFLRSILHPFTFILLTLAVVSIFTRDYATSIVMSTMVVLSSSIRFIQDLKSEIAADELLSLIENKVRVIRADRNREETVQKIPIEDIVPGDYVLLAAGDLIPGDIRLLQSKDLFISQAALTGESMPVMKNADKTKIFRQKNEKIAHMENLEEPNLCFMGCSVISGSGKAVVVKTGKETLYAAISMTLMDRRSKTAFQKGLTRISYMFIGIMLTTIPVVFLMVGLMKGNWINALSFSVSIAVALTPEILPAVINANLSRGARAMSKEQTIVKRMDSIMNFGAMDVLCTDKTGTLTEDKVSLVRNIDPCGNTSSLLIKMSFLNAKLQNGLRNLLDIAIDDYYEEQVLELLDLPSSKELLENYSLVDEIPFDFERRRVSVIVEEKGSDYQLMIMKGAVEEVLAVCTFYQQFSDSDKPSPVPLNLEERSRLNKMTQDLNTDGLRVLAVARKIIHPETDPTNLTDADECNMEFLGFITFLDPPKESTASAIKQLYEDGLDIKVLTGDSPLVCSKVCREIGMKQMKVITGIDVANADDKQLKVLVKETNIFAKLTPSQKSRVIVALKECGHVVGFLGDGINDAPALREADVGISVDSGTAIAKETADIILLKKDLRVLEHGVRQGRISYANTMKYLKLAVSGNFGNIFSVIIASIWLPFLPMLPTHIVIQNLLYGAGQIAIPWDNVDEEILKKPRKWSAFEVFKFMLFLGPLTTAFDMMTFAFLLNVTGWNTKADEPVFHAAWFLVGICTQQIVLHVLRTERVPFFRSLAAWPMFLSTFLVIGVALIFPLTPIAPAIKMAAPTKLFWIFLPVTVLCYCICAELFKIIYKKIFKSWI